MAAPPPQPLSLHPQNHKTIWLALGREYLLAAAEAGSFFQIKKYELLPPLLLFNKKGELNAKQTIKQLGGVIKIGEELGEDLTEKELLKIMGGELLNIEGKIHFGISWYGQDAGIRLVEKWGKELKNFLKKQGRSARYVYSREPVLSSVTADVNGLASRGREFLVSRKGNNFALAKTLAVQPYKELSARDYGRPGRDDKSGMLPPKLAMMMINIAGTKKDGVLLDPFCGSGTILSEAMLMGYSKLIGADISKKAINDTKQNIEWTKKIFDIKYLISNINLFQSDIKMISEKLKPNSINAIITEPYLGKPLRGNESKEMLTRQANELRELYVMAFNQFAKLLKPKGAVVIAIPRFRSPSLPPPNRGRIEEGVSRIKLERRNPSPIREWRPSDEWIRINFVEQIKKIGFEPIPLFQNHLFLTYARPEQRVGREIWKLIKN